LASKEDTMLRLLLSLTPANLLHELGSGRALDNARRDREELDRMNAGVDALAGRLDHAAAVAETAPAAADGKERVAA
jgi:hypothetical protein